MNGLAVCVDRSPTHGPELVGDIVRFDSRFGAAPHGRFEGLVCIGDVECNVPHSISMTAKMLVHGMAAVHRRRE
jgi:hypothetical protein